MRVWALILIIARGKTVPSNTSWNFETPDNFHVTLNLNHLHRADLWPAGQRRRQHISIEQQAWDSASCVPADGQLRAPDPPRTYHVPGLQCYHSQVSAVRQKLRCVKLYGDWSVYLSYRANTAPWITRHVTTRHVLLLRSVPYKHTFQVHQL